MAGLPPSLAAVALAAAVASAALAGCNKAPAELDGTPAGASATVATVPPLRWDAPAGWAKLDVSGSSPKKATYRIDAAGDDGEEAEANVFFFGTGAKGDPAVAFKQWFDEFDGNVGATAAHETFAVGALQVETVDVGGTFKIPLTPKPRGKKASPVQMVKSRWRLYGAVVKTPDRGNWFFKLTGPDDTVQAARSAFRAMLGSVR